MQERKKYETLCDELKSQKESEIEELQSNLSRLQAVSFVPWQAIGMARNVN